ncbi:MAG: VC0807 family protein, partial [Verrucomicrobiales bacterium]
PPENPLWSLLLNIAVPSLILHQFSENHLLGPVWALVVAIAIPLSYGIVDWRRRGQLNFFSLLGTASVVLTGGLGLIRASALLVALKEASFPLFFALAILYSTRTRRPLIPTFLLSPQIVDVPAIEFALRKNEKESDFEALLFRASLILSLSMLLCAALSFLVAIFLLKSEPGTPAFNRELGRMLILSFPIAGGPAFAVLLYAFWRLVTGIRDLTGLETADIFNPR